MGSQLHQALRNLCFNTDWNYAVFWKLKNQTQMILTWEDGYYDNHEQREPSENKCLGDTAVNSYDCLFSHDSLGLAMAKMSYHVYALGEGIVGQVAITGKDLWISANNHAMESCSLLEYSDGWLTQFSAGIRTIAVVAVVPHGVVQLGSLNNIAEDLKFVNHIRDIFFELQDLLAGHISSIDSSLCLSNVSTRSSASQNYHDYIRNAYKNMKNQKTSIWSPVFQSLEKPVHRSYAVPLPEVYPRKMVMINNNGPPEYSVLGVGESTDLLQSSSMDKQKQVYGKLTIDRKSNGETSGMRDVGSEDDDTPSSLNFYSESNLYDVTLPADNYGVNISCLPSVFHGTAPIINQNGVLCAHEISHDSRASSEKTLEFQREINHTGACKTCFRFSSGCELYEALGPSFKKQNTNCDWETQKTENGTIVSMSDEETSSGNLMMVTPGMEHLLEAVVANVCQSVSEVKCENPTSGSVKSVLTAEKGLEPSASDTNTIGSAGYSYDQSSLVEDALHCLASSGTHDFRSSKGFSSASSSRCGEQLERPREQAKIGKKRARPGENCRPRPRDRQLIQDRIKELRELVPNGSKCSIDSLLERTTKHMLFMQCATKHADKLEKCAESKLFDKKAGVGVHGSSSFEQGSSWAMEVENHLGVFPVMVENINMNGQMLVEVLCEDCSHFFEIAEAIRSLNLTILKGATEAYGEKIWMCFVVEGQNNRNMQHMDILWSLVQILQPRAEV